jgi:hypothetical protein
MGKEKENDGGSLMPLNIDVKVEDIRMCTEIC